MKRNPLLDISPQNPKIPDDLEENSKQYEISVYLWMILLSYGKKGDKWFLHPFPIHFEDDTAKQAGRVQRGRTTRALEGTRKLHTFDQWIDQDWQGADTMIGFFCTWTDNYATMTAAKWKKEDWHAFGAALRTSGDLDEWELLLWDLEAAKTDSEEFDFDELTTMQQDLVRYCSNIYNLTDVWICGGKKIKVEVEEGDGESDDDIDEEDLCMKQTGLWIHDCLRKFETTLPRSEEDLRDLHYRRVSI